MSFTDIHTNIAGGAAVRKSSSSKIMNFFARNLFHLFLLLIQLVILYLLVNPINLVNQLDAVGTINKIGKKVSLPPNEIPVVARVGDKKNLADVETLKKGNAIDAEIYKDAQDGDYVLGYNNSLVIYRRDGDKVVYNGDTAQQKLTKSQQSLVQLIIKKAQDKQLIPADYKTAPQVSVVTDPDAVKKINAFYADVQKDDLIAQFSSPDVVVVYRPASDQIVKNGSFALQIK